MTTTTKTATEVRRSARSAAIDTAAKSRVLLVCQECGKSKRVSPNTLTTPECTRCGSVDLEVAS